MKYFNTKNNVIKCWCDNPEEGAIEQAKNLADLPFVKHPVCLMPDTHQGYGMPIGGVVATSGVVIPNAVGVDIGCGMAAVKTDLTELSIDRLKKIMTLIRKKIPVGFSHHKNPQSEELLLKKYDTFSNMGYVIDDLTICFEEYKKSLKSLGTLGGGNHFIEIQRGDDGYIWFMVHSGSRNLGLKVAKYYNEVAKEINNKYYSSVDNKLDLAFLPLDSEEARDYLKEMGFCLNYAQTNRDLMVDRIKEAFTEVPCSNCNGKGGFEGKKCPKCEGGLTGENCPVNFEETINIHHNYARMENHFGKNLMIHRKGATSAKEGEIGIIPGSQGTSSYIVKGKGNKESLKSCSHGAGRKMSRTKAIKHLSLKHQQRLLDEQNILHAIRGEKDLDEAPGAYKDIDVVMEEQQDLVEVLVKLKPLAVIKG